MVVVRRPAEDSPKAFEEFQEALNTIQEYAVFTKRIVDKQRVDSKILKDEIEALVKKKTSFEGSLKAKEEDFRVANEKKGQQIMAEATTEAKKQANAVLVGVKTEVDRLISEKIRLEKAVKDLSESHAEKSKKLRETIQMLEVDEASLKDEVAKLTSLRDELRKQIVSIKDKLAYVT